MNAHPGLTRTARQRGSMIASHMMTAAIGVVVASTSVLHLNALRELLIAKQESILVQGVLERVWHSAVITEENKQIAVTPKGLLLLERNGAKPIHRLRGRLNFSDSQRIYLSKRGVASPTTIQFKGSKTRCAIIISLYGRVRSRCWIQ